jgi:hypothetical protein
VVAAKSGKPERKRAPRADLARRSPDGRRPSQSPSRPAPPASRAKLDTLGYEERPREPRPRASHSSSPELIIIEETPIGRITQHAIEQELQGEPGLPVRLPPTGAPAAAAVTEIFEISTFVVTGEEIYGKASEASRRAFVAELLLHRLPVLSMDDVVRIDLSRSPSPHTVILRVWTKVSVRAPG